MPCSVINHTMENGKSVEEEKAQDMPNDISQPSQSSNEGLNTEESEWLPGDLLWARIGRHPFWPCVVVVDPRNAMYLETKRTGRSSQQQVHVQYFGDNGSRSWVSVNQIMKYSGKNNLLKFAETKKKDKRYSTAFPQPGKNQKWDYAVKEAEEAVPKSRNERILFFEEFYPIFTQHKNDEKSQVKEKVNKSGSQKTRLGRKTKEQNEEIPDTESNNSAAGGDGAHEVKKRVLEKEDSEENLKSEGGKPLRKVKRRKTDKKPPGVFEVFVDRCANLFAVDRPEFQADRAKCIRFMRAMWSSMTEEEKSRYHGSYEDIESLKELQDSAT
ncbi:hypothetical protein R5R35_013451 [Gryllus longicercus]|uniref:PWWP domain-containing protein n=1 Tax=Gryllus longicercus TaxID=2509291 RepID=A0AAN9YY09_9ORTH